MEEHADQHRARPALFALPILGALIGTAAAVAASMFLAVSYDSTAVLLLHETTTEIPAGADLGFSFEPSQIVATNIEVIESSVVLQPVVEATAFATVEDVRRHFSAIRASNSDIIEIVATTDTAEGSRRLANAIVESYVQYLREDEIGRITAEIEAIDTRIVELESRLFGSDDLDQGEMDAIGNRIDELSSRAETRRIERDVATGGVQVIDSGNLPLTRSRSIVQDALIGGFLGLTIGIGISILLLLWPRRSREPDPSQVPGRST